MKKTVLIKVSYLVELQENDINDDDEILNKITNEIDKSRNLYFDNNNILLEWNSTSSIVLDSDNLNCGKCSNCGQWTTDREKPNSVEGICNGATVKGELLCDECLPHNHRWAF